MSLSIIIPTYNEERTIREIIKKVYENSCEKSDFEVIVVDDGSVDKTSEFLKYLIGKYQNIRTISLNKNYGKTYAVRKGMEIAKGDYIAIQDADLEYNPVELFQLYKLATESHYEAVYGSRLLKPNPHRHRLFLWGNVLITKYYNILFKDYLTDISTCYKIFKRNIVNPDMLNVRSFGFCPQITCMLRINDVKIVEYPISYEPRSIKEGKSIRPKEGLYFLWIITKNFFKYSHLKKYLREKSSSL